MNASLASILSSTVLEQLALGSGVPLGALGSAFLFHDISFLWPQDFIAIYIAKFNKAYMLLFTILCTTLAVTVGPSSATAHDPCSG